MELVIFCGIQATGKSSLFRERFVDTHIRINMDMLRTRHRESLLFEACLAAKQPVVIDNTNPTRADRARYIEPARNARFTVVGYYFQSELEAALARNASRGRSIPEAGIRGTFSKLEVPSVDEGFDELFYVALDDGDFRIDEWRDDL